MTPRRGESLAVAAGRPAGPGQLRAGGVCGGIAAAPRTMWACGPGRRGGAGPGPACEWRGAPRPPQLGSPAAHALAERSGPRGAGASSPPAGKVASGARRASCAARGPTARAFVWAPRARPPWVAETGRGASRGRRGPSGTWRSPLASVTRSPSPSLGTKRDPCGILRVKQSSGCVYREDLLRGSCLGHPGRKLSFSAEHSVENSICSKTGQVDMSRELGLGWVTLSCGLWTVCVHKMLFIILPAFPWWNKDVPAKTSEHHLPNPSLGRQ